MARKIYKKEDKVPRYLRVIRSKIIMLIIVFFIFTLVNKTRAIGLGLLPLASLLLLYSYLKEKNKDDMLVDLLMGIIIIYLITIILMTIILVFPIKI
ncbi:MAG: hypothetical protein Q8N99_07440 [Nanoarchaeota archaeon]|nr:hypothetical protein [Nanoarchaeota archaeon]